MSAANQNNKKENQAKSSNGQQGNEHSQQQIMDHLADKGLPGEDKLMQKGEITNNDGSVVETLDTAFHNKPGMIKSHSVAGSNRADYYEAQSQGKSDSEEEMEYLRKKKEKR